MLFPFLNIFSNTLKNIYFRTGDWWRGYGTQGYLAMRNFVHCLATHMYYVVEIGDEPHIGNFKGWMPNTQQSEGEMAQMTGGKIFGAEYQFPMMQWWHCRYNLSFACEGTVTNPKSYYGYKP